jgi:hypothetical protein
LVPLLVGTALAIFFVMLLVLFVPRKPSATVALKGYRTNADGKRQAMFTITNSGRGTLRRWDFYKSAILGDRNLTRHHIGPDAMLAPGQSEDVAIDIPSTDSDWQITFHFTDYNVVEENAYLTSGSDDLLGEVSRELIDGKVDLKVSTGWIHSTD